MIAFRDAKSYSQCAEVLIFPQAAPVQFWLTGCDTYNETTPKGVFHKCFCQPWKCTDTIIIPFRDTFDESEIVEVENIVAITLPNLDDWLSLAGSGDYPWTLGVNPTVNLPGDFLLPVSSEYLYASYAFVEGKGYSVTIDYDRVFNSGVTNQTRTTRISVLDSDFNVIFTQAFSALNLVVPNSHTFNFTANEECVFIAVKHTSGADVDITITSATGTRTDIEFTYPAAHNYDLVIYGESDNEIDRVSFDSLLIPAGLFYYHTANVDLTDLDICEQQIRFEVEDLTASPDSSVAKSDCQNITDSEVDPTILIEYSSSKNFNGLVFEGISPDPIYNIRIPAVFFHEDFPQEDEVAKLTSKVIKLNSQTQAKRLLDIDFIPYFMHLKIQLILSMPIVQIDDLYWTKQDGYELGEGSKRWPVKRATCWLTQRDFLERQSI